jgi:hypothetical protein
VGDPQSSEPFGAETILIIRHGEKPLNGVNGVTIDGVKDEDSLIPRGWQRAGALVDLLAPEAGPIREGLARPGMLFAPQYGKEPENRRTHQTITPLSEQLGLPIEDEYEEGKEPELGKFVSTKASVPVVLICWEHDHIPAIPTGIVNVVNRQDIPTEWPSARFDLVWRFQFEEELEGSGYYFSIFPQLLLPGDSHPPR